MEYHAVDLKEKFGLVHELWSPKVIAQLNDYHIKIAKIKGDFTWHKHEETDEVFIVQRGELRIDFRDGTVMLKTGQLFVVERGKEHKPFAENECEIIMLEPSSTLNTGNVRNEYTKETPEWL